MNNQDYKNVFVFIEQREGKISKVGLELLGKATQLATALEQKVVAMLAGHNIKDNAQNLIEHGADVVLVADHPYLEQYLTEQYAQAIGQMIVKHKPNIVLFGATTIGRDLAPRLSARLETGLTADCTKLEIGEENNFLMTRPAFGGNLMATIVCPNHRPQMSTVRPGVMMKNAADTSRKGEIIDFNVDFDSSKFKVEIIESVTEEKNKIDIADAKVLISGGRGVGCYEGYDKLAELAKLLKAEVAASRALVDAGIATQDRQVGQTGKTVRPDLYFAFGISGAIQHLAGMEESDFIIAVNKDKSAPIFSVADLGIVGDLCEIVPLLTQRLTEELADK
ncbi:MAG: electron transfer flavoprotein subunit alpha/FixB family protein [Bacteroidales bacterium]